jgi:hypothetical protein
VVLYLVACGHSDAHGGRSAEEMMKKKSKPIEPSRREKIVAWVLSSVIAAFYLLSCAGWVGASFMAANGMLKEDAIKSFKELSMIDHAIRISQVLMILIAMLLLLLRRSFVRPLLWFVFSMSLIATLASLFNRNWAISFLGGFAGLVFLGLILWHVNWLRRKNLLK